MLDYLKTASLTTAGIFTCLLCVIVYHAAKYLLLSGERKKIKASIREKSRNTATKLYKRNLIRRYVDNTKSMLSKTGANYLLKRRINPYAYIAVCGSAAVLCAYIFGGIYGFAAGAAAFAITAAIPRMILKVSNSNDNKNMLRDVKSMYDSLVVQTSAGMFLTSAIRELSANVKNERLKTALAELSANISLRIMDFEEALEDFNNKFSNPHIDMLVLVLKQSLQSGRAAEYLKDLQDQMGDIQHAIELHDQESTDLKLSIVEFLVYIIMTAIVLAALFVNFTDTLGGF